MGHSRLDELHQANPTATDIPDVSNFNVDEEGMDTFFKDMEAVQGQIEEIRVYSQNISEKHGQKLASVSQRQGVERDNELDELNTKLTSQATKVRNVIKKIDAELKSVTVKDASYRLKMQQHAAISRQFFDVMTEYNKVQQKFKKKYRERVVRQYKIVKPDVTDKEIDEALSSEAGDSIFAQQILSPGHQEAKKALEEIKDRHEEIIKLEKSIKELHQLFLDMAVLINQQGEMLDRIEFNVSNAEDYTAEAAVQLNSALSYQRSARKKKLICLAIVIAIIIAVIVILIIKLN